MNIQIPNFNGVRVLVVGDVMLDRYWSGDTSRVSPEAPIPIVHVREQHDRAGGAGNVALNVAALGATASILGLIGKDKDGDLLEKKLLEANVESILQRTDSAPTITKLRVLSRHQQLIRLDFEEEPHQFSAEKQLQEFKQQLPYTDMVILSDYNKGVLNHALALIEAARSANVPVLVDPKKPSFGAYRGATLLTPNMKEFQDAVGPVADLTELEAKAREQIVEHDLQGLLITRSEHGMSLIPRNGNAVHIPTLAREVFDVTGAGDTVIATLACAIAAGQSWSKAMALSNLAAGISISKIGAATVSVPELRRALHEEQFSGVNVVTPQQLKILVADAQAQGEKVVMTNGCFDILHAGHIAYLEEAKTLGNRLIVAVNDDGSVRRLKGESRPVNPLDQRMTVLAGLRAVDWVVPFSEDTPAKLIADILPNVLVKGGDYQVAQVAGADSVLRSGGEVKILCFKEGLSTSAVIQKMKGETV